MKFLTRQRSTRILNLGCLMLGCGLSAACGSDAPAGGGAGGSSAGAAAAGAPAAGAPAVGGSPGASGAPSGESGAPAATGGSGVAGSGVSNGGAPGSAGMAGVGAGAPGAAGAGVGAGGGPSASTGCAGKTYKLCEDFETGTVGALPTGWTTFKGYGATSPQDQALSSEEFHSGGKALKSISAKQGISRIQKNIASLGPTATKHWGRIFYKVQSPAAQDTAHVLHVTFVSMMGTSENRIVDTVEAQSSNKHQWLFNNPNDQGGTSSAYDWTFDAAWHCAEWFVDVGTKSYRFFSDAKEVTALAFTGKDNQMTNYTTIIVGATHYQTDPLTGPFTVWFDDLAINDTQIGCQ